MPEDNLHRLVHGTLVSTLILLSLLLVSLSPLMPRAQATTFTGNTLGLVNLGQATRDSSSAVPVMGFSMTASGAGERLVRVTVSFAGTDWQAGDDRDLRRLDRDPRISGVGIFRDSGSADDALDTTDFAVTMASGPTWSGSDVVFDFNAGGGTNEPIPTSVTGNFHWIVAIRITANNPADVRDTERITVTIRNGAIIATSGAGFVTQPGLNVNAADLTVDITKGIDIVGSCGCPWVGPASALVNSKAVLGLHIVDGGINTNRGIQDSITSMSFDLVQAGGAISSGDFQPITTDPTTSGIALYVDNPTAGVNDEWDAADTGISPATITPTTFPAGTTTFTVTFSGSGVDVPNAGTGSFDFFLAVRTKNIATWDQFHMTLGSRNIHVRGLLTPMGGSVEGDLRTPQFTYSSSTLIGDATPPYTINEFWFPASNYLFANGLDLHFSHDMTTTQFAAPAGWAVDSESGLDNATFSQEPSLASSPGVQSLGGAGFTVFWGFYGFNATSTAASSPIDVTIYDQVGNSVRISQEGRNYRYIYDASHIIILPDPGWTATGGFYSPWVDASGKLWFSQQLFNPASASVDLKVASLSGAELTSISASSEATLGGPTPASLTFSAGTFSSSWSTTYTMNASANDANSPVTVTAMDNLGNTATATFAYGLDTMGPAITMVTPTQGSTWGGNIVAKARVVDDHTTVSGVLFSLDNNAWTSLGLFDGTNYFVPISTAYFADGKHRLTVTAQDVVGNLNSVSVDVTFWNGPDTISPTAAVVKPIAGSYIQGSYILNASATDNTAVASVDYTVVRNADNTQVASGSMAWAWGSYWQATLNTLALQDGDYRLTVKAKDAAGNWASDFVDVHINNVAPTLAVATPVAASYISGQYTVTASATGAVSSVNLTVKRVPDSTVAYWAPLALADSGYYQATLDTLALADGDYSAVVAAKDVTGLVSTATVAVSVDNNAPTLQVASPAANAYLSGSAAINATATDAHLDIVTYSVDLGPWVPAATVLDTTKLSDGSHSLTVRATDHSGKWTTWDAKVVVDNTAPTASLSSLVQGQTLQGIYTYRVFAWDAVGVKDVTMTVAGQTVNMVYNPQSGYWEYTIDTKAWTDGGYTAQATIEDLSGKKTTTTATSFAVKNQVEPPKPDYLSMFSGMVPMLFFLLVLVGFVAALGLLKSGAVARWLRPHEKGRAPMVEVEEGGFRPPTPPTPPILPPPGSP